MDIHFISSFISWWMLIHVVLTTHLCYLSRYLGTKKPLVVIKVNPNSLDGSADCFNTATKDSSELKVLESERHIWFSLAVILQNVPLRPREGFLFCVRRRSPNSPLCPFLTQIHAEIVNWLLNSSSFTTRLPDTEAWCHEWPFPRWAVGGEQRDLEQFVEPGTSFQGPNWEMSSLSFLLPQKSQRY